MSRYEYGRNCCNCNNAKYIPCCCERCIPWMDTIQLQLIGEDKQEILKGETVKFNHVEKTDNKGIYYDKDTGKIHFIKSGIYHVSWWVATDGVYGGTDTFVGFGLKLSNGKNYKTYNGYGSCQLTGEAIITVIPYRREKLTMELKNITNSNSTLSMVPIKGGLIIWKVD